ncbi:hypothetical protein [Streptomyces sp. 135]|uniref:hypothetical protein n=1 Tax=Streptomyces sp. 135 TaxID=2838850 RepID=UPI001CBB67DF|nr:hypothetical protein [Streptomyces sp. 135]
MSPQAALALTQDRRRCTGESHQALSALLEDDGRPLPVPAARRPEQALLETAVFLACCKIGGVCEHPLGIVQVRPDEDQLVLRLANEPYVTYYWVEFLLPRLADHDEFSSPQDWIIGVPGLRYRRERGGICLYRPGMPTSILLTGFNPHWWDRVVNRLAPDYDLLQPKPDWTPEERTAYAAAIASPCDPPSIYSPLLRRIRATAGPGPINSTDAWHAVGGNVRLETTDGPPCPDLIRLLCDGPTGLGWEVEHKRCTCLCDHTHADIGCNIDFCEPATGRSVYYSNAKWGRTLDDRRRERIAELNREAFA